MPFRYLFLCIWTSILFFSYLDVDSPLSQQISKLTFLPYIIISFHLIHMVNHQNNVWFHWLCWWYPSTFFFNQQFYLRNFSPKDLFDCCQVLGEKWVPSYKGMVENRLCTVWTSQSFIFTQKVCIQFLKVIQRTDESGPSTLSLLLAYVAWHWNIKAAVHFSLVCLGPVPNPTEINDSLSFDAGCRLSP